MAKRFSYAANSIIEGRDDSRGLPKISHISAVCPTPSICYFCTMKIFHFTLFFLLGSTTVHAQALEEFFSIPKSELKVHLKSLPQLCDASGVWVNAVGPNPMEETRGTLSIIYFGSFEDPVSLDAIRKLNKIQIDNQEIRVILSLHPRYEYSRSQKAVMENLKRYGVALPVLLDTAGTFWDCMKVEGEETTVILSPDRRILGRHRGNVSPSVITAVLARLNDSFRGHFSPHREPFYGLAPSHRSSEPVLRFPTGLAAQPIEDLIYVSDLLSHRILGITSKGNTIHCIGSDDAGFADGTLRTARFNGPRGLAFDLHMGVLYVADTYNHRVRKIDFAHDTVSTVLGNGMVPQFETEKVFAADGAIGFPVALAIDGNDLYISTAGPTSGLWRMDTRTGTARKIIPHLDQAEETTTIGFGGLTVDPTGAVFFSDPYTSSLKYYHNGEVQIAAGQEKGHGFGDGKRNEIQFQFPNGLAERDESIFIADTYNHAIRSVQPFKPRSETIVGDGQPGFADGPDNVATLNLPMDVAFMNGKLYIADAGNGAIRIFDPETKMLQTMTLHNYGCIGHDKSEPIMDLRDGSVLHINKSLTELDFTIDLGEDWVIDPEGFSQVSLITRRHGFVLRDGDLSDGGFSAISVFEPEDRGSVAFDLRLFVSNLKDGRQYYRALTLNHQIEMDENTPKKIEVILPINVMGDDFETGQ